MSAHNFKDLTGQKFDHLTVLGFNKNTQKWICQCDCKDKTIVEKKAGHLKIKGRAQSCGCANKNKFIDISNQRFGHLVAKEYCKELGEWLCQCDCGRQVYKKGGHLRSGATTCCGFDDCEYKNTKYVDLTNKRFGKLVAIRQVGESKWLCQCDCGNTKIIRAANLVNGSTASCGCANPYKLIDITMHKFGHLTPIEHLYRGTWLCQCDCGNICEMNSYDLRKGRVMSCGCVRGESSKEVELVDYIKEIYNGKIIQHNRTILDGKEIDILIPDKRLAFEFNGNYWHSLKERYYHQEKTIACAKQGIQLIHIFEYEWDNRGTKEKLKQYIRYLLSNDKKIIYARNTEVQEINNSDAAEFLNKYHMQGSITSPINIGCYYNNQLIGVITLGKPRFNHEYEYEIHRLCWMPTVSVIGGSQKLFSYFTNNYHPHSIITYSDISKFTGNIYSRLGFKPLAHDTITKPNYVWVSHHGNNVIPRYKTQKAKLVKDGLGTEDQTELEIMESLGYFMVNDCGSIKLEWIDKVIK